MALAGSPSQLTVDFEYTIHITIDGKAFLDCTGVQYEFPRENQK